MTKAFTIRLPDEDYDLITRLADLSGQSRNAFVAEVFASSRPALETMVAVLDRPRTNAGQTIGALVAAGADAVSDVRRRMQALETDPDADDPTKAPTL